jgi:hypothetical protein
VLPHVHEPQSEVPPGQVFEPDSVQQNVLLASLQQVDPQPQEWPQAPGHGLAQPEQWASADSGYMR